MRPYYPTWIFLFLLVVSSCSVQKRVHSPGFHVEWTAIKARQTTRVFSSAEKQKSNTIKPESDQSQSISASLGVSAPDLITEPVPVLKQRTESMQEIPKDSCDKIILRGGFVMRVKVIDIGSDQVKYRDCKDSLAVVKQLASRKISTVTYSSGLKILFDDAVEKDTIDNKLRKVPDSVLMGDALAFMGLFFAGIPFGIAAIVLGITGITRIQKSPEKHKGTGWAVLAIVLGLIDILGALIVISNFS